MRQWQKWGLAAIAALAFGGLLWAARGHRAPDPPFRPGPRGLAAVPDVAARDAVAFREPDPIRPALSVSFLDAPFTARSAGPAPAPRVPTDRLDVASLRASARAVPEPSYLVWAAVAIIAGVGRRRRSA